ncbi:hypothetical protein [Oscillibacter sp.]|uniref:hypothetical protein n=1 Tax=Oscillibacter sp. TaxID=1945593 RepID=UPI00263981FF|nr:hypothetical protein [Oscillibacter sp.]MDD3346821.1 hypothetical protein [Oscillibacter sp.]
MTGRIFTSDHHVYDFPAPLAWNVVHTGTVPCDSFSMTFLYEPDMAPVLKLAAGFAAIEGGKTVLRGIVDEYTVELGTDGLTANIVGRGYAARLLDNESRPLTYQSATLAEIVRSHVTPYGITCGEMANLRASSVYTVASGSSQWKALEGFCRTYGGFTPRFSPDGKLLATPEKVGKRLTVKDGDMVLSCTLREDHYGVLTEVLVIDKTRNVSYSVKNQDMLEKGGQCRRVIYTPGQSTWDAMRYTGEYQIKQSRQEEKTVTLCLPGSVLAAPGDRLTLDLAHMGLSGEFRVAEAENIFSAEQGATVKLTAKEA